MVKLYNGSIRLSTDDIIPVSRSIKEISASEYNHVGKLLSNGEFTKFTKEFIRTIGRDDIMAFESRAGKSIFGFEIGINDCSINSSYQMSNVFEAYLYLLNNNFEVSRLGKETGFGYAKR